MFVRNLNHFTLKCTPEDLASLNAFYIKFLGLVEGPRPDFPFPGHWLYSDGRPIVHLAGLLDVRPEPLTGPLDHISFSGVDLAGSRELFKKEAIAFEEVPVPGWPLQQIFIKDPGGLKIELTFDLVK